MMQNVLILLYYRNISTIFAGLGLPRFPHTKLAENYLYDRIKELDLVKKTEQEIPKGSTFEFIPKMIGLTALGGAFREACVAPTHKAKA